MILNKNDIKLFATYYISLQENLNNSDKIKLIRFIKESTVHQTMNLLNTDLSKNISEINKEKSEEIFLESLMILSERVLDDAFSSLGIYKSHTNSFRSPNVNPYSIINITESQRNTEYENNLRTLRIVTKTVAVALLLGRKAYKEYFSKAAKQCNHLKGEEKENCFRTFYINANKKEIQVLNTNKKRCKTTKDPQKCERKINEKIKSKERELHKILSKKKVR